MRQAAVGVGGVRIIKDILYPPGAGHNLVARHCLKGALTQQFTHPVIAVVELSRAPRMRSSRAVSSLMGVSGMQEYSSSAILPILSARFLTPRAGGFWPSR